MRESHPQPTANGGIHARRPLDLLRQGWRWWRRELVQSVPDALADALRGPRQGVDVRLRSGLLQFFPVADGSAPLAELAVDDPLPSAVTSCRQALAATAAAREGLTLFVPESLCLRREVALPLATEDNLDDVLGFELDRLTPFTAARAWFGYRLLRRVPEAGKLVVTLWAVPREPLDPVLAQLRELGFPLRALHPDGVEPSVTTNLYRRDVQAGGRSATSAGVSGGAVLALLLLAALALYPVWQLQAVIDQRRQALADIRPDVEALSRLESRLAAELEARNALVASKAASPSRLELLRELTQLTPDNTWVRRLEIVGDRLVMRGESRKASELVTLLDGSPLFADVAFSSPVTRDSDSGIETFELRLTISGGKP